MTATAPAPKLGTYRVADGGEYGRPGRFVIERYDYCAGALDEPRWHVPARMWLEPEYASRRAAAKAIRLYTF